MKNNIRIRAKYMSYILSFFFLLPLVLHNPSRGFVQLLQMSKSLCTNWSGDIDIYIYTFLRKGGNTRTVLRHKEVKTREQKYIGKYSRTFNNSCLKYKIQYKYTDVIKTSRNTIAPVEFRKCSLQRRKWKINQIEFFFFFWTAHKKNTQVGKYKEMV